MSRVAITGLGAVTPLGIDAPSTWAGMLAGKSGVSAIETFDASTFPVRIAAQVPGFDPINALPSAGDRKHLSRAALFGAAAALEAVRDAGAGWGGGDPFDRGVAIGATVGRPELQEMVDMSFVLASSEQRQFYRQPPGRVLLRDQNVGVAAIARLAECMGPAISVSTACAGAAHAIGEGYRRIQEEESTAMVAGGFDSLTTWLDVLGFSLLGALNSEMNNDPTRASRPFDANRAGFVLGEGAVMAVLENWDIAVRRGAHIYGELVGYGSSLNAYRITDSPPDGGGAIHAMQAALDESGLRPADIDYIVAHGTGTHGNDLSETTAIKAVFGAAAHELVISSPKSMTGHLTSAAAGINLIAALGAIRDGRVSPTINLDNPDPKLDLDYVPLRARTRHIRNVLVNAFAFGGTNASFVIRSAALADRTVEP
ncbi:MAG: beta-ketoacyl-[acyl-carrier-protein] synthase family protein [Nakamurella sp.]